MTTTTERTRPQVRSRKAPRIREVCLVGDQGRRYVHMTIGQDSGPGIDDPGFPRRVGSAHPE